MCEDTLLDVVHRLALVEHALERLTLAVDRLTAACGAAPVPPSPAQSRYVCRRVGCGRAQNKRLASCCQNCSRNEGHSPVCDNAAALAGADVASIKVD